MVLMYSILLTDTDSTDDFVAYKAPYLASCCCSILPEGVLSDLLEDDSILDSLFMILFNQSMSCMFTYRSWLKCRREGLFQTVVESLVRKVPMTMFHYLSGHAEYMRKNVAAHMNSMAVLNIGRFLLDVPLVCMYLILALNLSKPGLVGRLTSLLWAIFGTSTWF